MNLVLREYQSDDRDEVSRCITELQNYEVSIESGRIEGEKMANRYLQYLLEECEKKSGKIFIAEMSGKIIGFIGLIKEREIRDIMYVEPVDEYVYITDFMVLQDHRNQGIGKKFLQKAEEYARSLKLKTLKAEVLTKNLLAKEVYRKLGFKDHDITMVKYL